MILLSFGSNPKRLLVGIALLVWIAACQNTDPILAPEITKFSPTSGVAGNTVVIEGANFSNTLANNKVQFNGVDATLVSATSTSLTVTVPVNATTGPIKVTTDALSTTSTASFTLLAPTITSFSPLNGVVGATITITGTNFSPVLANNVVKFNGVTAVVTAATSTSLTVVIPSGATSGTISFTIGSQSVTSAYAFTVTTNTSSTAPTVSSFSPSSGNVGTVLTITGTNFSTTATNNTVTFNGTVATVTAASATSLTVTVPSGATTGKISVKVGSNTATSTNSFTVTTPASDSFTNATMKPWFDTYCSACHAAGKSNERDWLYDPDKYSTSIKAKINTIYSEVYTRKSMPQGTQLSAAELAKFKTWYDAGYPAN